MIREQLLTQPGHPAAFGRSHACRKARQLLVPMTGPLLSSMAWGHAVAVVRERDAVSAVGLCAEAESIVFGQLYFVAIPSFEGEMRIGLGRAEELQECGRIMSIGWLQRRVWSNEPSHGGFCWPDTPSFDAA
eukprot:315536-Pleurochrysis_carterae.AAC.1